MHSEMNQLTCRVFNQDIFYLLKTRIVIITIYTKVQYSSWSVQLKFILTLKIKRNDWLLADTCLQATNHCTSF